MQYQERRFELTNLEIRAQEWGLPGAIPVLALHGWLDNAASFDVLAPQLENVHLVALDCAGHGLSGHRTSYNIWEDVAEVFEIADQLGWQNFALLGHSRGAIISALSAGTFPERISHLALIDSITPPTTPAPEAAQQLARSIVEIRRHRQRGFPIYPDVDSAIEVREQAEHSLTREATRLLIRRGLKAVEGGYTWSSDPKLKAASAFRLSDEHVRSFLQRITAPTLLVPAEQGVLRNPERYSKAIECLANVRVERLPGRHHLHMEPDSAAKLSIILNQFLRSEVEGS